MLAEAAIGNAGVWAGPALLTLVGIGLGLARGRWVPWVQGGCLIGAAVLGAALLFPWNVLIPLVVLLALVGLLGVYRASKASSSPPRVRLILESERAQELHVTQSGPGVRERLFEPAATEAP